MKMSRKISASCGVAALTLAMLTACAASSGGNTLRIGATATIDSLNPFVSSSDYSNVVYQYVYPHLTEYDTADMSLQPSFASSWTESDDKLTWTFTTIPDAKWSDGEALTAEDAAFTMSMVLEYQDSATGQLAGFLTHLASADAPSPDTLVLTYNEPASNVLAQMQQFPILPEHVWKSLATGDGAEIASFANGAPMVSGGPFLLNKYEKDQFALFDRNPNWWGQTKPQIDGFGFQFFANDDAMVTALKTGQVDMIGATTPATAVQSLKDAGMVVQTAPSVGFYDLIINTTAGKTRNRELLDPRVREALEYATDRASMVDTAWLGFATPGSTIVAPASGWHDDSISGLPFDLDKANAILDELGYAKGSDGIRNADGHRMAYDLIFPTEVNGAGDRMFQVMQTGFAKAGIEITMRKMDTDSATAAIRGADGSYADYDLAMWLWAPPVDPNFVLSVLTCDQRGNNSDSGYCNADYDALFAQQAAAPDRAARQEIIDRMQQVAFDERPYIVLLYQDVIEAHSPQWTGFTMSPLVGSVNNLSMKTLLSVHRAS
ncbi:ABC transporter substrate-binding protein [Microbacterium trichothecenolyticum]|uniref:Peptide/nickel transport system substrate-binding protein n=1 Tax=Microbacterium trichothecenolyticum TaxID=69370 RepID=A0ABU0TUX9_MICTR|nr:ABC transporter substrate-binding protein [Microbacterium trichothecenolyticum]MDQ1123472.1 peptide/nickel transport system substrate-binding protein [Microbacterium trichothecenolyticum]